jgi:hypothetical protein
MPDSQCNFGSRIMHEELVEIHRITIEPYTDIYGA